MRRSILFLTVLVMGCGDKPPAPAAVDPAAEKKLQDELKAQQTDLSKRKVKEGIPPED